MAFIAACALAVFPVNASAQVFAVSGTGVWGAGVPTTTWTAPNATWQFSVTVSLTPLPPPSSGSRLQSSAGFDVYFSGFTYSLNGATVDTSPSAIAYFTSSDGEGLLLDDFDGIDNAFILAPGTQLFTGSTSNPTFLTGTFPAQNSYFTPSGGAQYNVSSGTITINSSCQTNPGSCTPSPGLYTFTNIDYPGATFTQAFGINDTGQIVGFYINGSPGSHGFLLNHGTYTSIDYPGAGQTQVWGISGNGAIVGTYDDTATCGNCYGQTHSFLLSGGVYTTLPEAPGSMAGTTAAKAINSSGQIVGSYTDPCYCKAHGFLLSGGVFTTIDFPGFFSSGAAGINDSGEIVGTGEPGWGTGSAHGFLLRGGVFTTLDDPVVPQPESGYVGTIPMGINNRGDVAGEFEYPQPSAHGFILSGGTWTNFDVPNAQPGSTFVEGPGVNSTREIVGDYVDSNGVNRGFLATAPSALLVEDYTDYSIKRYDGNTGAFIDVFVAPGAGGLSGPTHPTFGPDGNLYVGSIYTHSVKRYNGTTGAYIDDFLPPGSGGGISPYDVTFGPDGNLYVASGWDNSPGSGHVKRFNGTTGAYIDDFVPSGSGGLDYAQGLVFGPDGNLYVADNSASAILRYDGTTGAFIGVFAPANGGDPTSLTFGPDGNLYVSMWNAHQVERYNGATGADMGAFVPTGSGDLDWDYAIAFGPDGNLYETERYSHSVKSFDGNTGAYIGDFVSSGSGGLGEALWILWAPGPGTAAPPASQTITFAGTPSAAVYNQSFTVSATASSGLPVTITASGVCTLAGSTVTMTSGTGACVLTASQAGNAGYSPAPNVVNTVTAQQATPTVSFIGAPASAAYGATFTVAATTNASTSATIIASGACSITGNTVTMTSGTGTCNLTTDWAADANYTAASLSQSTTATKIAPTVSFTGAPASAAYRATFTVAAITNASTTAVITAGGACSITGTTVTMTSGTGACSLTANWTADANYTAASATQSTLASKAVPVVAWATPAAITYGAALSGTQLNATANVAGTFTYSPLAGTVLGAGPHILSTTLTPTDATDYSTASAQVALQVNKAAPVIAWTPASIQLGYSLGTAQLDATASVPGTFAYTPTSGTAITTSSQTLSVLFTPTDTTNYTTASRSVSLTVTPGPLASVSPSSLAFGTVYLGTITVKNVTVTNQGTGPMTITDPLLSIASGGDSNEFLIVSLCQVPLAPGKSCSIVVTFVAGPYYNPQTATLSVKDNAPGSPQTVSLTATVINPQADLDPGSLSFGTHSVNSSTTKTVTLTNSGATALSITNIAVTGSSAADFMQTSRCPSSLAAMASCTVSVTFKPVSKNTFSAGLTITDNALSGTQTVLLTGAGK
ncbi:MAG: choice-of-anchor D domain-containing protein [Bryobacteraceae bacterium]